MKAVTLTNAQDSQWDAFVAECPNGTLYHSSEWKRSLESAFPHIKGQFIAIVHPKGNAILAGLPIYRVSSRLLGTRLVCVPYATWCDPLFSDPDHLVVLLEKVRELADLTKAKLVEIRCREMTRVPQPNQGFSLRPASLHHRIDLRSGADAIWKGLSPKSIRQLIKRATKRGVAITSYSNKSSVKEFYDCLTATRKRLGLPMIPRKYFLSLWDSISEGSFRILIAREGAQTFGAVLLLLRNGICHLEFTGEYTDSQKPGTMQLLKWEAIRVAYEENCSEFSFGRTTFDNEGLIQYKRRWNPQEETIRVLSLDDRASGKKDRFNSVAKSAMKFINRNSPKRFYIALGSYIYAHWG
ncbi:MAG: hypothetical protein ACI92G_001504 [Candidatus Pelagisphaera sp.]|jgi:hypothetical protein